MRSACPNAVDLRQYVGGELSEDECRMIENHLDWCASCESSVSRLEKGREGGLKRVIADVAQDPHFAETGCGLARELASGVRAVFVSDENVARTAHVNALLPGPGDQIDDFRILNELGAGAFATVYLAQQKSMQRLVALKIGSRHSHAAPVLSNLDHPHIVRVYDERVLEDRGLRLLYMQYIPGGSLKDVIKAARRTDITERSGRSVLDAIQASLRSRGEAATNRLQTSWLENADWVLACYDITSSVRYRC